MRETLARSRWRIWLLGAVGVLGLWLTWQAAERRSKFRFTREAIAEVQRAVAAFRAETGRCPRSTVELVHPPRAAASYLNELPSDGWGQPLYVRCPGWRNPDIAEVVSAGPSGSLYTNDNIY